MAPNSLPRARNYLLDKIDEELIAYVDADVVLDKEWAIYCLKEITGFGVACVNCSIDDNDTRKINRYKYSNTLEAINGMGHLDTAAILIKRKMLQKTGGFDDSFDLTYKMLFEGHHLASSTKARAQITRKENPLTSLARQLVMGYVLAKALLKYNVGLDGIPHCSRVARLGLLLGRLRFFCTPQEPPPPYYKQLFSDDGIYCLHPALRVCLRKNDVLVVDIKSWNVWSIDYYQGELLAKVMRTKVFIKQFMAAFISNGMFLPIDLEGKAS